MLISVPRSEDFGSINQVLSGCDRSVYLRSVLRVQVNTCDMDYTRVILRKKLTPVFDLTHFPRHLRDFIRSSQHLSYPSFSGVLTRDDLGVNSVFCRCRVNTWRVVKSQG